MREDFLPAPRYFVEVRAPRRLEFSWAVSTRAVSSSLLLLPLSLPSGRSRRRLACPDIPRFLADGQWRARVGGWEEEGLYLAGNYKTNDLSLRRLLLL
jgi:hypothetical protein